MIHVNGAVATSRTGTAAPGTAPAAALSRHGIKSTRRASNAADIGTGDDVLSRLADALQAVSMLSDTCPFSRTQGEANSARS